MWAKGSQRESGVQSARFFIVDLEGRASVAATLLPGDGGVQQEKLLLQTNNFCGGMASGGTVPCRDSAQFFWKYREDELAMASAGKIPDQRLYSTVQLCVLGVHSRRRADNEGFPLCMPDK